MNSHVKAAGWITLVSLCLVVMPSGVWQPRPRPASC